MQKKGSMIVGAAAVTLFTNLMLAAPPDLQKIETVFEDSQELGIHFSVPQSKEKDYTLGPWQFGPEVRAVESRRFESAKAEKPSDKRLNIYVLVPGTQHHSPSEMSQVFDHNLIINAQPAEASDAEFDVFWAVVLDPHLRADYRSESDLLLGAQERFRPGDLFEFDDIPASPFLESVLHMESVGDLRKFRKKDGSFPRLLILPAGFALRAGISR